MPQAADGARAGAGCCWLGWSLSPAPKLRPSRRPRCRRRSALRTRARRPHTPGTCRPPRPPSASPACGRGPGVCARELHTGLSPDKFALCSPRTGHPGQPVPAKPEREKKTEGHLSGGRNSDRTNPDQPRPDQLCPPVPRPKRNGRSRPQRSTLQSVVVAGSRSSSSRRQNRRRPRAKSVQPAAVNLPRPIASPQVLCYGNQRSEGDGHPLLQCTVAPSTRRRPSPKWCDGPGAVVATATDLTAHAGPARCTWRPCSTLRPGWAARASTFASRLEKKHLAGFFGLTGNPSDHVRS